MLSVIIPCYNEETLVKKSFNEIFKALKDSKITQYEIIFFDDGSKDRSHSIVEKLQRQNKKIKIVRNKKNYGIGYNFFKGVSKPGVVISILHPLGYLLLNFSDLISLFVRLAVSFRVINVSESTTIRTNPDSKLSLMSTRT